jgi:hypothetical protein
MDFVNMDRDQYQLGKSKVFIKNPESVSNLSIILIHSRLTWALLISYFTSLSLYTSDVKKTPRSLKSKHGCQILRTKIKLESIFGV